MTSQRFFDAYPQFYETSSTGADADRLHERYRAIIEFNKDLLEDSKILDIASHDGRWSFAALEAGAKHVTGVEIRPYLVENSHQNLWHQNIAEDRFCFICGDALGELAKFEAGRFDVVMCLGYLYHTVHIAQLIQRIAALKPKHIILDTQIAVPVGFHEPPDWLTLSDGRYGTFFMRQLCKFLSAQPLIILHQDETEREGMAVYVDEESKWVVVGYPTIGALEMLLDKAGYMERVYYDWLTADLRNPVPCYDYRMGHRVTMRCSART